MVSLPDDLEETIASVRKLHKAVQGLVALVTSLG
jgi:hypothetical protein